ncbi:hypothetical protein LTR62_007874 [Meristemomyces frigidus]|uniref:MAGE domain-containing protein n=1 Tax=Meristemomyces frigidus TaxID=1508187 RepID=A0AAN7YM40_9PEZI|nr:hypothetical protein LTR62_007874 [Meristemomyces frigidus]
MNRQDSPGPATQRRRRTERSEENEGGGYGGDHPHDAADSRGNMETMVKKLVRLALACEYQRRPIRRTDISEKVLGTAGARKFKDVFLQSQLRLRSVFGMEMVELPAREKVTLAQKRAAQSQSQSKSAPASYILISVLPTQFHDSVILPPPAVPSQVEESKYISIYTTLISLISLSGGQLNETKMHRYLRRLQMEDNTPVAGYNKTENLLKRIERENYLVKVKEVVGTGDEDVYWTVGPRGRVEVGDDGVAGLTKAVYGEMDEEGEAELDRRIARSLALNERVLPSKAREAKDAGGGQKARGRKKKGRREEEEGESSQEEEEE